MRFIYKILIGLIIFNGVLILFAGFFPDATESGYATNVTDEDAISGYGNINQGLFGSMWTTAVGVGGAIFLASIVLSILTHQYALFMSVGGFIAILSALWSITSGIITKITDYQIVSGLVTIIIIVIGIIAVLSVVEMLNAQRGAD